MHQIFSEGIFAKRKIPVVKDLSIGDLRDHLESISPALSTTEWAFYRRIAQTFKIESVSGVDVRTQKHAAGNRHLYLMLKQVKNLSLYPAN